MMDYYTDSEARAIWHGKHSLGDIGVGPTDYVGRHRNDHGPLRRVFCTIDGRHSLADEMTVESSARDVWRHVGVRAGLHAVYWDREYVGRHRPLPTKRRTIKHGLLSNATIR